MHKKYLPYNFRCGRLNFCGAGFCECLMLNWLHHMKSLINNKHWKKIDLYYVPPLENKAKNVNIASCRQDENANCYSIASLLVRSYREWREGMVT